MNPLRCIDAHTAGEPLRLIVDGFPPIEGRTMLEKRAFVRDHHDHLRRALMLEPRGHLDMYGALLTEPEREDSDAGVLFMHNEGYSTMCGHGIIAVVTLALERRLIVPRRPGDRRARRSRGTDSRAREHVARGPGRERQLRECAVVRPARRCDGVVSGRASCARTWRSAGHSTRSWTAKPPGSPWRRSGSAICARPGWRSSTPSRPR